MLKNTFPFSICHAVKHLAFLLLLFPILGFGQSHFIKFTPITFATSEEGLLLHTYWGYEQRFAHRTSLELGVHAAIGPLMVLDGGSLKKIGSSLKYRYFFHLPKDEFLRGYYIGALSRYQYQEKNGGWSSGKAYSNFISLGPLVGKNIKITKRGSLAIEFGWLVTLEHYRATLTNLDPADGKPDSSPIFNLYNQFLFHLYGAIHWGISLDKKSKLK